MRRQPVSLPARVNMPGEPWALIPRSRDAIVGTQKARHRDPVARSPGCGCLCSDPGISLLSGGPGRYPHPGLGLGTPPPTVLVLDRSSVFSSSHGYFDAREKAAWELNGAKVWCLSRVLEPDGR
ncbi:hypothetical protein D8B26_000906 [Coccidioides posadasii str. Silveira]|uniref:uncharacterized protein n=1 Tax=Coccidioides posadasii (strain RMSCC 757 / Silveira) TaxID=443226 RepID=UPI001BEE7C54|nr:hypothetical protein D8B26_000906 [Coccidioides posadasii str. Silveira]